ncbi:MULTISPECIES: alpha-galactosidase [unclassified Vibrio]|uniref:Alpha-galactosidase n=1 Tax=Vibrio sp. HB236076 TaxID=3232307 RepID=A0AB39HL40_9VIBR|nr:alpha-galactosidase [Vibrio sp. HB161653]MDP5253120.1 alpha-galactosidase [Vibrio sp. HB161653]
MKPKLYSLTGQQSQLILSVSEVVEVLHYGKKITTFDGQCAIATDSAFKALARGIPYGRLDSDVPVTFSPDLGRGHFGSPGLEGHREGQDWAPVFQVSQVSETDHHLQIDSVDEQAQLLLSLSLTLGQDDVLIIQQRLTNLSETPYWVNRLATTLSLPERADELLTFHGRWVKELQPKRLVLPAGGYQQENRRGRTSHEHFPGLIVGQQGFDEQRGEVWGAHLAWSGNHRLRVDVKADGRRLLQAEALYFAGEISLLHQQTLTTPKLYVSYSSAGLNTMSQQFHRHVRRDILTPRLEKPRPIHLNTWEGIYFDHQPDYIKSMASKAASIGVERFIIDDGWFLGRNDDTSSLGDWYVDQEKYPQGLKPVIDHVHEQGMEFGLWFEPEMINKDSQLYRQHPDWLLEVPGYQAPTGRHQYTLNLVNPGVIDYLYQRLAHFLSQYEIDYIKWDMNREVVQPGHLGRAAAQKQVLALYQLMDKLSQQFPHVDIESCASGGGRMDYGILTRSHRFWLSDNNDALERQTIQRSMSYFFPLEVMGCHIGADHSHTTRRRHSLSFRALTALFGHMGLELDPNDVDEDSLAQYRHYIAMHKQWRSLLHSGDFYRLNVDDDKAQTAYMVCEQDQSQALMVLAQLEMPTFALSGRLRVPGLAADGQYLVKVLDAPDNLEAIVNQQPPWLNNPLVLSGEWLAEVGLATPLLDPESALLLHFEKL